MENKIGKKQKKLYWNCKVYKAVKEDAGCQGCSFREEPCPVIDGTVGYCSRSDRLDKTSIIWKEKK